MGRHSLDDPGPFWRSVILNLLKWVLVFLLPLLLILGIVRLFEQRGSEPTSVVTSPATTPTRSADSGPTASPQTSPVPTSSPTSGGERVQVLNGTSEKDLGDEVSTTLEEAGYDVVASEKARQSYEKTTVFYQPGSIEVARSIAGLLGSTEILPAPENLDESIVVTVVVGADYRSEG